MPYSDSKANTYLPRIRDALMRGWDPIGVGQYPEAHDEYDGYAREVFDLLIQQPTRDQIFHFLWNLETGQMGLTESPERHQHTDAFSRQLFDLSREICAG